MINLWNSVAIFIIFPIFLCGNTTESYWQQRVDYEMEIILDEISRSLHGTSVIDYYNNSPDTLNQVFIHLYPNAFQPGSVKFREYNTGRFGRDSRRQFFKNWKNEYNAEIKIDECFVSQGNRLLSNTFKIEDTILELPLREPILPKTKAQISIKWTHMIGQHMKGMI